MEQTDILIRPVITEKSMDEAGRSRFTFVVAKAADKAQIRHAVEEHFKVDVISVQTITMKGKTRRAGKRRIETKMPAFKKAIVGLKEGQRIDLFDVQKEEPVKRGKEKTT